MNLSTLNPKPDPIADAEADRLAELADRVADLRRAVDKGTLVGEVFNNDLFGRATINNVLIASSKANIDIEIGETLTSLLSVIQFKCEIGASSSLTRLVMLHVVSCIENLVELAGES